MDRIINVAVNGSYLTKDSRMGGVQYESNSRYLRVSFDHGWDRYAKKITFWNAQGQDPVEITLTTDKLEDAAKNYRRYLCPIPGEALTEAGEFTFVIDGYVGGVRQRSVAGSLLCERAPYIAKADQPSDPTPTQAEQLQVQIDAIKEDIQGVVQAAEIAQSVAGMDETVRQNAQVASDAAKAAQDAQRAAEQARDEAQDMAGGDFATETYVNARAAAVESNANAYAAAQVGTHSADKGNPHGVSAEQVGARANTWMPTAAEVGAFGQFGSNYRMDLNEFVELEYRHPQQTQRGQPVRNGLEHQRKRSGDIHRAALL